MSGVNGSMNSHTLSHHNGFILLINYNNIDDIEMNEDLKTVNVSCGNSLINSHTLYKCNEPSSFNDMDLVVEKGI